MGLEAAGSPWEVYLTDPQTEKDTSKWLTKMYQPVK
ncbi:Transcriptional regulator, effector-binding domain/component [Salinivirga cyanobacteriivorans]|uniref:Transcriptional regulator, effector-binding domain/component n=2 Tax=Salinivirga TaxID=1970191 RepID=A0A0S2HW42_9BACT|nr:Transcriptional regulator, effector-binding domain/component [Salinivirga cyanobacteriivorans]